MSDVVLCRKDTGEPSNVQPVCACCGTEELGRWTKVPLSAFEGCWVKKLFTWGRHSERMWVAVNGFSNGVLTGRLDNEPSTIPRTLLRAGDPVTVRRKEIYAVACSHDGGFDPISIEMFMKRLKRRK